MFGLGIKGGVSGFHVAVMGSWGKDCLEANFVPCK